MIREPQKVAWLYFVLPALLLWAGAVVDAEPNLQRNGSLADVTRILVSMDRQILQVDGLIEKMRNQVEEQYTHANTEPDPANRRRLETLAEEMAEKLMQMEEIRAQLVDERSRTGRLLHEIRTNE